MTQDMFGGAHKTDESQILTGRLADLDTSIDVKKVIQVFAEKAVKSEDYETSLIN